MAIEYQPGTIFERNYELSDKLGTGGLGTVFKARQLDLNRSVAIKILHEKTAPGTEEFARFKREAQILSQSVHPNVVQIYNIGLSDSGFPYLVMELLEGSSLRKLLNESQCLPPGRALKIARDTALALTYLHKLRVIHRDIKPDNIILCQAPAPDTVKLIDFGLAKQNFGSAPQLTKSGLLIGTADYMSPEQCKGQRASETSDIYSLTVVLYEMLTGSRPFTADTPIGVLYKHINEPVPAIEQKLSDQCPLLDRIIKKGLAKTEAGRYKNAEELAADLEEALQVLTEKRTLPGPRPKQLALAVLIPIVIGATTLLLLHFWQNANPTKRILLLPKEQAATALLELLRNELNSQNKDRAFDTMETIHNASAFKAWTKEARSKFDYESFELLRQLGADPPKLSSFTTDSLLTEINNCKHYISSNGKIDDVSPSQLDAYARYLLTNPPDKKCYKRIFEINGMRVDPNKEFGPSRIVPWIGSPSLSMLLGRACLSLGKSEQHTNDACQNYLSAAELSSDRSDWNNVKQAALSALELSANSQASSAEAHVYLSRYYLSCGDIALANKENELAEKLSLDSFLSRTNTMIYQQSIELAERRNDWTRIHQCADRILELALPQNDPYGIRTGHKYRLYYFLNQKEPSKAIAEISAAKNDLSGYPDFFLDFCLLLAGNARLETFPSIRERLCLELATEAKNSKDKRLALRNAVAYAEAILAPNQTPNMAEEQKELSKFLDSMVPLAAQSSDLMTVKDFYCTRAYLAERLNDFEGSKKYAGQLLERGRRLKTPWMCRDAYVVFFRILINKNDIEAVRTIVAEAKKELNSAPHELCFFYFDTAYHSTVNKYPGLIKELCDANRELSLKEPRNSDIVRAAYCKASFLRQRSTQTKHPEHFLKEAEDLLNEASRYAAQGLDYSWTRDELSREKTLLEEAKKLYLQKPEES